MSGTNTRDWRNHSFGPVPPPNHRGRGAHQPGSFPRHQYGGSPGHPSFASDPFWNTGIGAPGHHIPGDRPQFNNTQGGLLRNPQYPPVNPQYSPRNINYPQVNRVGPPSYRCTSPRCPSLSREFRPPYRSPIQNINNSRVNPGSSVPQTSRNLHESSEQLQVLDISSNSNAGYRCQAQNVSDHLAGPEKKQRATVGISSPTKGSAVNQGETTFPVLQSESSPSLSHLDLGVDDANDPPTTHAKKKPKRGGERVTEADDVMHLLGEKLKNSSAEDDFNIAGKNIGNKLRNLPRVQTVIAEKLINDVIFEAEMGSLNRNCKLLVIPEDGVDIKILDM